MSVPRNTPINTTTIASLTEQGMGPALIIEGGVDRLTFNTYLEADARAFSSIVAVASFLIWINGFALHYNL